MRVSVVIPCYNAAACLARAIQSVQRQGVADTEVIVVDDASTDGTVVLAEQLRSEFPNLRIVVQPENGGPAKARNAGLRQACGEYVCFLDADDAYGENVFSRCLALLDGSPWIQAVDFPVRLVNSHREVDPKLLPVVANSLPSNLIARRELVLAVGGFPESPAFRTRQAGEDATFRAALRAWGNISRLDDVFLDYTVHPGSHFDFFLDRARIENNALRLIPDESDGILAQGRSAHLQQTSDRMRFDAGIQRTRQLTVQKGGSSFNFETFDNEASLKHATETLRGETYLEIPFLRGVDRILDIGSNIGASCVIFALRYPKARIVGVEPSRRPFILLRGNTIARANVKTYNVGLLDVQTRRSLFIGRPDSVTNSVFQNALSSTVQEEIQLVSADRFAKQIGMNRPDIIKIDTEGCELPIVSSMVESFRAAKAIYLEYHSEEDRRALDAVLAKTHILYYGRTPYPHRGELVYVRDDAFPAQNDRDRRRIGSS